MNKNLNIIYSGSIVFFVGKTFNVIAQYLLIILLGRNLGANNVGLFFLGFSIISFTNVIGTLGYSESILKFIPEYLAKNELYNVPKIINFISLSSIFVLIICALFLYYFSDFLGNNLFNDANFSSVIQSFSLCLPFYGILSIFSSILRAFKDILRFSLIKNIFQPWSFIVFSFIVFYFSNNINYIIFSYFLSILLSLSINIFFLRIHLPTKSSPLKFNFSRKKIFCYSIPFMGSGILGFFLVWMDTFMLGIFRSSSEVGIYSCAARIALFSNIILVSVNSIFGPIISDFYTKKDFCGLEYAYKTTVRWIVHISLPFFFIIFIFPNIIMETFGEQFIKGASALTILCVGQFINISVGSAGYILNMTGKPRIELINQILSLIINFSLNFILIPKMGINGAAIATSTSISIVNIFRLLENYYFLNIHPYSIELIFPKKILTCHKIRKLS